MNTILNQGYMIARGKEREFFDLSIAKNIWIHTMKKQKDANR